MISVILINMNYAFFNMFQHIKLSPITIAIYFCLSIGLLYIPYIDVQIKNGLTEHEVNMLRLFLQLTNISGVLLMLYACYCLCCLFLCKKRKSISHQEYNSTIVLNKKALPALWY